MLAFVRSNVSTPDSPGSFAWAVATGKTFFANLEPGDVEKYADPDLPRLRRRASASRAACVVPLVARGRTIGAMCALQAESGRRFGDGGRRADRRARAARRARARQRPPVRRVARRAARSRGREPRQGRVPRHARPRAAQPAGADRHLARGHGAPRRRRPTDASARIIERQVAHLSRMVDDLLDVSRITHGKIELRRERVDLRDVIARALELTEPALRGRAPAARGEGHGRRRSGSTAMRCG